MTERESRVDWDGMTDTTATALADRWLADVDDAIARRDWPRASRLASRALEFGFEHPRFLQLRAAEREQAGRLVEARADLERALALAPDDVGIANALGACLTRLGEGRAATAVLSRAAELAPHVGPTWASLGAARLAAGDAAGGEDAFRKAVEIEPAMPEVWGRLAVIASNRGDAQAARERASRALALDPHGADARRAMIEADLDLKNPLEAERGARAWLAGGRIGPNGRSHALGLLGDALEAQGRFAEAFEAYRASKAEFGRVHSARYGHLAQHPLTTTFDALCSDFASIPADRWRPAPGGEAANGAVGHVFLMGFMRSGTTLLEQALSRHPDVAALEETEALAQSGADYLVQPGGLSAIAEVRPSEAAAWRAAYWRAVDEAGVDVRGKVLIDKLPFNGVKLPIIAKLFPNARIVFAVRDPRDVVLSCFQKRFQPNAYTFEMRTLEGAARLYAGYMVLCADYRAGLPLHLYQHRHETLLEDVEGEVARVAAFIGLDFRPEMTAVDQAARSGRVLSQSARQLGQGLNTRGVARWRNYAAELAPVADILQPWVEAFGYPA